MLIVERHPRLRDIPAHQWNALAGHSSFYGSHGWLSAVEGMPGALCTSYYLARSAAGDPVGAVAAYVVDRSTSATYYPDRVICGLAMTEPPLFPAVLVGGRTGYTSDIGWDGSDVTNRRAFLRAVVPELRDLADQSKARRSWLLYADTETAQEFAAASGGQMYEVSPSSIIELPGDRFDDWLASFPGHRRRRLQHEIRAFSAAGYRVESGQLSLDDSAAFGELLARLLAKYRGSASAAATTSYMQLQARAAAPDSLVFKCYRNGQICGFSYGFQWRGLLYMRACGFDYEALGNAYEYFNLVYYLPVRAAYDLGLRGVELGPASYQAKVLRGARLLPRYAVSVGDPLPPSWTVANARLIAKIRG